LAKIEKSRLSTLALISRSAPSISSRGCSRRLRSFSTTT